jgi:hypothetical protein
MVDFYPEDITSEAEEEIAGQTTKEAAEEEIDGGAEEEEQDDEAQAEEEQIPRNLHGYWVNAISRTLTSKLWKTRVPWPLKQSPTGELTSKPWCRPQTPLRM